MLTKVQHDIVNAPLGACLVTAGAGSGKTRVLTHRIAHLLESGIPDWAIVALTFTNKAAAEMRERIEKMQGHSIQTFLGTFHSFCVRILRKNIHHLGYTSNFSIYDQNDSHKVVKEICAASTFYELEKDAAKIVEYHLGKMKNEGMTVSEYRQIINNLDAVDEIMSVISAYEKRLKENNALDFDDLLLKTLELFDKHPDVLQALQNRFQYILVDEFQDTNHIQYQIVKLLAEKHRNIMCVGDEDQCIYTWRGASIDNLKRFCNDFSPTIFKLEENFRSACNIVETANLLISHNTNRLDKVLHSALEIGEIEVKNYYDDREEAKRTVEDILFRRNYGKAKFSDFAILMRINSLSRSFEEQLLRYNIPYSVWGGFKFYERMEVRQALSYLRVMVNPRDEVAIFDAISLPRRGVGESSFQKLMQIARDSNQTAYDLLLSIVNGKYDIKLTSKAQSGIEDFVSCIEKLKSVYESDGLGCLAQDFLGITRLLSAYSTGKEDDERRKENLYELAGAILEYAKNHPEATLEQYVQSVTLDTGEQENAGDRVILSTVHSAKGLEFSHVYIVGMEDGIFPLERAKLNFSDMEEERRLLYVAVTRARHGLTLSSAISRFYRGVRNFQEASRFLEECGF
ncbi:MAG: ATP-dependent helicase [Firmicutes bacterium]|nr:ATP-dependent helicase [Bacillota bacterium]